MLSNFPQSPREYRERFEDKLLLGDYARVDAELTLRMACEGDRRPAKINSILCIVATLPFLLLALLVGLFERAVGTDGAAAAWVARPFLRAVERRRRSR